MINFNSEEASVLLTLIDRVQLSGKEAETVAYLKGKIRQSIEPQKENEEKTKQKVVGK